MWKKTRDNESDIVLDYPGRWGDIQIAHLVIETENFIVFVDKDSDVDWVTTEDFDQRTDDMRSGRNSILSEAARIESIPNSQHDNEIRITFKRIIGEAIARGLENNLEDARNLLERARIYIESRNEETARYWQLQAAIVIGLVIVLSGLLCWLFRDAIIGYVGKFPFDLFLIGEGGVLGAILSMIFRMGKLFVSSESGRKLHYIEVLSRCVAGGIAALLVGLLIKSGFILPASASVAHGIPVLIAAGMVAGASERWAPSIVAKFDQQLMSENDGGVVNE